MIDDRNDIGYRVNPPDLIRNGGEDPLSVDTS